MLCLGGGERNIIYSSQRSFYLLVLSSLSRVSPSPFWQCASYCHFAFPQQHRMYAVFMLCTFPCYIKQRTEALSPSMCLCLFSTSFRRYFFFSFVFVEGKMIFGANVWVPKRLVHSLLIARKLLASICRIIVLWKKIIWDLIHLEFKVK